MTPFHAGELLAQRLAGGGASGAGIRNFMPDQHRKFFSKLPLLLLGTVDDEGWPMAAAVAGQPGFVSSPDATHLAIAATPDLGGPVARLLRPGRGIGLLGIEFATRRRNRANGMIEAATDRCLHVAIREGFGNCAKYIQPRDMPAVPAGVTEELASLDAAALRSLAAADTAFVATAGGDAGGVDMSHRGGPPGFIAVKDGWLSIPDYPGNRFYNTLGNLLLAPRAAMLLLDFLTGATLLLRGTAEVDWREPDQAIFPGAERSWRLRVQRAWRTIPKG